jgi:hypothetical protein
LIFLIVFYIFGLLSFSLSDFFSVFYLQPSLWTAWLRFGSGAAPAADAAGHAAGDAGRLPL